MMNTPENLLYTKSHEWVLMEGDTTRVGLTDHAQEALGDVESVKAVSDVYSPVSGTVKAVNEALMDAPEGINADPYGAWLVEVEGITDKEDLLDAAAYAALCAEEG